MKSDYFLVHPIEVNIWDETCRNDTSGKNLKILLKGVIIRQKEFWAGWRTIWVSSFNSAILFGWLWAMCYSHFPLLQRTKRMKNGDTMISEISYLEGQHILGFYETKASSTFLECLTG